MFNFGLFTTHMPYLVMMVMYMLYFGSNILNNPEEILSKEDTVLEYYTPITSADVYSFYSLQVDVKEENCKDQIAQRDKLWPFIEHTKTTKSSYNNHLQNVDFSRHILSRPPPAKMIA